MNVWIRKTRKRVLCRYCGKLIEVGQYQVVCVYFMKLQHGGNWKKTMHFHAKEPYCWVDRAVAELSKKPVIETRGRKASVISDDNKEKRVKILRRRASVMQRIKNEMEGLCRPGKLLHMTEVLERLAVEIEPYGGVPESWR